MKNKILLNYSDVEEFGIRGGYRGFGFKLMYLGFQLYKGRSIFELTFYLNDDSEFEISKQFEKDYVLKRFGDLDKFLSEELEKIIEEIERKLKIKEVS